MELKTIADVLKDILAECWIIFDETTIKITNVDPEKIIVVNLCLTPKQGYTCSTAFTFPLYAQTLYRVLRGVKSTDQAILQDGTDKSLHISIATANSVIKNEITLQPLRNSLPLFHIPPRIHECQVTINSQQFYHILHDLAALSRQVTITIRHQVVEFRSQDDQGTLSVISQHFPEMSTMVQYKSTFIIKYLEKFSKPALAESILLQFTTGAPLNVIYHLPNGYLDMSIASLG